VRKALILDRDGVINFERGDYVWKQDDFILHPQTIQLMVKATNLNYLVAIVTNQGGVDKGLYNRGEFSLLNTIIINELSKWNSKVDAIYACFHHPSVNNCLCRKPNSLFFERIVAKYKVDPNFSYMIGDREKDIIPAKKLGFNTVLVGKSEISVADAQIESIESISEYFDSNVW